MTNVGQLDVAKYPDLKAKGLVSLTKVGKTVVAALTTFNPADGTENDPQIAQIYAGAFDEMDKQVAAQRSSLDALEAGIAALKADVAALG